MRSAGLPPTHPLSPFVPLLRPCPRRDPASPSWSSWLAPLVLEKGSPPGGARDVPPGLGVTGAAPGRPIALPAPAASSQAERLAAPPPKLPLLLDTGT